MRICKPLYNVYPTHCSVDLQTSLQHTPYTLYSVVLRGAYGEFVRSVEPDCPVAVYHRQAVPTEGASHFLQEAFHLYVGTRGPQEGRVDVAVRHAGTPTAVADNGDAPVARQSAHHLAHLVTRWT